MADDRAKQDVGSDDDAASSRSVKGVWSDVAPAPERPRPAPPRSRPLPPPPPPGRRLGAVSSRPPPLPPRSAPPAAIPRPPSLPRLDLDLFVLEEDEDDDSNATTPGFEATRIRRQAEAGAAAAGPTSDWVRSKRSASLESDARADGEGRDEAVASRPASRPSPLPDPEAPAAQAPAAQAPAAQAPGAQARGAQAGRPAPLDPPFLSLEPPKLPAKEPLTWAPHLRSGGLGFALGVVVTSLVVFAMWRPTSALDAPNASASLEAPRAEDVDSAGATALGDVPQLEVPSDAPAEPPPAEEPSHTRGPARPAPAPRASGAARPAAPARPAAVRPAAAPAAVEPAAVAPEPAVRPGGPLPSTPTREDVVLAIQGASPAIRACAPDASGALANIRFTFVSTGRVTSAVVPSNFAGPAERSCVARAARAARVPPFSDPSLVVTYPVQF